MRMHHTSVVAVFQRNVSWQFPAWSWVVPNVHVGKWGRWRKSEQEGVAGVEAADCPAAERFVKSACFVNLVQSQCTTWDSPHINGHCNNFMQLHVCHPTVSLKALCFWAVRSFIWTHIVTMISLERLEQSQWN